MRRLPIVLAVALTAAFVAPTAPAAGPGVVSGGGTGTFDADLDGDGDVDGSHFGVGAIFGSGTVRGHFECLMAGNADILGLPLMAVEGKITSGTVNVASGTVTFGGVATVNLGNPGRF